MFFVSFSNLARIQPHRVPFLMSEGFITFKSSSSFIDSNLKLQEFLLLALYLMTYFLNNIVRMSSLEESSGSFDCAICKCWFIFTKYEIRTCSNFVWLVNMVTFPLPFKIIKVLFFSFL